MAAEAGAAPRQVAIVGAGITGLLTATECALAGHRVTVLDRGAIPNPESSSFDQHRAIRTFVPGDPAATRRMVTAHRRWLELEDLLGARIYRRVGVVTAWPRDQVAVLTSSAIAAGVPVETVEPEQLPHLTLPAGSAGVVEVDAGVLLAERVLRALARWLAGHPSVTLRPHCAATALDADSGCIVLAGGETLHADVVLVAAGPGARDLIDHSVVLHRQTMVYLRPPEGLARWWGSAPAAGGLGADGRAWVVPPGDGTLLKISSDAVRRQVTTSDDDGESQLPWVEQLLAAEILRDVDSYTVVSAKACHYATDADTGGALLARMGPAVWSRAACGGTGFSSAPLVASEMVETMMEEAA
jgi:glycine/D-amino acid oxidase-like deaminating enzyme